MFEWTTRQYYGDRLDLTRLVGKVPRGRRVVIDGDGNYNGVISVDGDANHPDEGASRRWSEICDSLSDKICQPTLHPLRANVRSFLFYAYDPAARSELGRIGVVGYGWNSPPPWAAKMQLEHTYYTDKCYLRRLGLEVLPAEVGLKTEKKTLREINYAHEFGAVRCGVGVVAIDDARQLSLRLLHADWVIGLHGGAEIIERRDQRNCRRVADVVGIRLKG